MIEAAVIIKSMRSGQWLHVLLLCLAVVFEPTTSFAMMGEPTPLRRLIENAAGAAILRVESAGLRCSKFGGSDGPDSIATFVIEQHVFSPCDRPLRVYQEYHSSTICPPPPYYVIGERYFAFLYRDHKGWHPLLYGPAGTSGVGFDELAERVLSYRKVMAIPDQSARANATADWLVDSVAFRATRSDALKEIAPEYILIDEPGEFAARLSTDQLDRLVQIIPKITVGLDAGWHVGQIALLMKLRHHRRALPALIWWLRNCPTTPEILPFAWIASACASLANKPDSQVPFMKELGLTRKPDAPWSSKVGFYVLAHRRSIMCSFVDHILR